MRELLQEPRPAYLDDERGVAGPVEPICSGHATLGLDNPAVAIRADHKA